MPRKKFLRRLDPFRVVSQTAIEAEARYVARESEHYLPLSLSDLRERHESRRRLAQEIEATVATKLSGLAERERLAFLCMIWRDFAHLAKLYDVLLASMSPQTLASVEVPPDEQPDTATAQTLLPFQESLFG